MRLIKLLIRGLERLDQFLEKEKKELIEKTASFGRQSLKAISSFVKKHRRILNLAGWTIFIFCLSFVGGALGGAYFYYQGQNLLYNIQKEILEHQPPQVNRVTNQTIYLPQTSQEEKIVQVVKEASPAVVTIVLSKEMPVYEQYFQPFGDEFFKIEIPQYRKKGTKKERIGSGSGFFVSPDGLILTNKHVVIQKDVEYSVVTSDGRVYPAKVLAIDPFHDAAIIKLEQGKEINKKGQIQNKKFPYLKLGDSDRIQIGQTVIAIGNPLGEFQNTVSVGVVSGLGRSITASGAGITETIDDVIQTDAAINRGNSGGPLLNLKGEVIGINTAMVQGAENLGFAIPINQAKRDLNQFEKLGKIVYPFLGIRYVMITPELQEENNLPVSQGAWIRKGNQPNEVAVVPNSAADKAGLKEGDIILEVNGEKVTMKNKLSKVIHKYSPGDKVVLKVMRDKKIKYFTVVLGEKSSESK